MKNKREHIRDIVSFGSLYYDEAHEIRSGVLQGKLDKKHQTANFMFRLSARVRELHKYPVFALTGTPIVNGDDDIVSLFHFLGQEPECDPKYFAEKSSRIERLKLATEKYVIRDLRADMLSLPDKWVCTHYFHFSKREVQYSEQLGQELQSLCDELNRTGNKRGKPVNVDDFDDAMDCDDGGGQTDGEFKNKIRNQMRTVLLRMRQQCVSEELITEGVKIEQLYHDIIESGTPMDEATQSYIIRAMESST